MSVLNSDGIDSADRSTDGCLVRTRYVPRLHRPAQEVAPYGETSRRWACRADSRRHPASGRQARYHRFAVGQPTCVMKTSCWQDVRATPKGSVQPQFDPPSLSPVARPAACRKLQPSYQRTRLASKQSFSKSGLPGISSNRLAALRPASSLAYHVAGRSAPPIFESRLDAADPTRSPPARQRAILPPHASALMQSPFGCMAALPSVRNRMHLFRLATNRHVSFPWRMDQSAKPVVANSSAIDQSIEITFVISRACVRQGVNEYSQAADPRSATRSVNQRKGSALEFCVSRGPLRG